MIARILLALTLGAVALQGPGATQAASMRAVDSVRFQVTIGGTAKDNGTLAATAAASVTSIYGTDFSGCAIVKQKAAAEILGAYSFEIHISPDLVLPGAGIQPMGDGLYLSIDNYRPAIAGYGVPQVSARFAFKGRAYGGSVTNSKVTIRNGGRDGSYTDRGANRLYPAKILKPLKGLTFQASWHCSTVYHLNAPI